MRRPGGVARAVREYEGYFTEAKRGGLESRERTYREANDLYYDLATDFYEYGWGKSFHFAPRAPGESFQASLARHEHYLALALGLRPGMVAADLGCGIGGPLVEIARFSGAKVIGVNSNGYQLERARRLVEEAELTHLGAFLQCDFLHVEMPDDSFDAAYSIEATCCAPDKPSIYGEVLRLLKPGACFAAYEWVLTDRFDAGNPHHVALKSDIELGTGVLELDERQAVDAAFRSVGFETLETRDLAEDPGPSIPWYEPLVGSGRSLTRFRSSRIGGAVTHNALRVLERLHVVPRGAVRVSKDLRLGGAALAEAGQLGIFTPMYFIHGRKPLPPRFSPITPTAESPAPTSRAR
jgi:sterol 24-C-methyltransferase